MKKKWMTTASALLLTGVIGTVIPYATTTVDAKANVAEKSNLDLTIAFVFSKDGQAVTIKDSQLGEHKATVKDLSEKLGITADDLNLSSYMIEMKPNATGSKIIVKETSFKGEVKEYESSDNDVLMLFGLHKVTNVDAKGNEFGLQKVTNVDAKGNVAEKSNLDLTIALVFSEDGQSVTIKDSQLGEQKATVKDFSQKLGITAADLNLSSHMIEMKPNATGSKIIVKETSFKGEVKEYETNDNDVLMLFGLHKATN